MPAKSQAQLKAMYSAAAGHSTLGIPASVGRDFVAATPPGGIKKLPKRVSTPVAKSRKPPLPKSAGHLMSFGSLAPAPEEE